MRKSPDALPPAEFITAGGMSTPYTRIGEGKPVLLIHSLGGSSLSWAPIQRRLAAHADVVAYDWGGHGFGEKPAHDFSISELGQQAAEVAARLFTEPAVLAGVAAGSAVALATALARPEVVSGLVLGSPTMAVSAQVAAGMRARAEQILRNGMRSAVEASIRSGFAPSFVERNPGIIKRYRHEFLGVSPDAYARSSRAFASYDVSAQLADVVAPALLLPGEHDPYFPPEHAVRIQKARPEWKVELLKGVGHYGHLEAPERVMSAILEMGGGGESIVDILYLMRRSTGS